VSNQPLPNGGWVDIQEDVTEKRRAERRIKWLARHDPLTEVSNRLHFREALQEAFKQLGDQRGFALHWIDLDKFKEVNDTLGHPVGDALLKSVAKRLLATVRKPDLVARLGGDEFAVIQAEAANQTEAKRMAMRMVSALAQPHLVLGQHVDCGASIGVALAPGHGGTAEELLKSADLALYSAKSAGRGTAVIFEPGEHVDGGERRRMEKDLKEALRNGQLELYYQPIIDIAEKKVASFESLMRWHHPELGTLAPAEFIPIAEETGQMVEMGFWALREACREAVGWPEGIRVTINLSAVQFQSGNLLEAVETALSESGLLPERLELEITESVLLLDDASTLKTLHDLRALGIRIALDDFGTAYASLSYLRSFPFDKIKLDRSFVRDLGCAPRQDSVAIVHAVASLASQMHMTTTAEGVETTKQMKSVLGAGYDELQGFYFSEPVPAQEVGQALDRCRSLLKRAAKRSSP
jgi:diguanylate cyclase (GGDEF)-like protein